MHRALHREGLSVPEKRLIEMTRNRRSGDHATHDMRTSMRVYRFGWLVVCAALTAVGVTIVLILSPAVLVFLFLVFAVVGVVLMVVGAGEHGNPTRRGRTRRVLTAALVVGTTPPAYVGLAVVLGAGVFLLMLIVVASSPYALRAYARWLRVASTASKTSLPAWAPGYVHSIPEWAPPQLGPDLHRLTTEDLCQAWCASYLVLVERSSGTANKAMLATVEERQRYLDELERRNATGLAAWLASGARVASNPLPYLCGNHPGRPVIDWDELT
jgi:hypothetical protein